MVGNIVLKQYECITGQLASTHRSKVTFFHSEIHANAKTKTDKLMTLDANTKKSKILPLTMRSHKI